MKRLIGRTDMEDALKRLDKLTQEEARMAVAENLKATHAVDERVRGVASTVVDVDNRVAVVDDRVVGVSDQVARVDDRVADIDDRMASVDDKVAIVNDNLAGVDDRVARVDGRLADVDNMVAVVNDNVASVGDRVAGVDDTVKDIKRSSYSNLISADCRTLNVLLGNQLRDEIHKWLSPPDPSTNHAIACGTHQKKTAAWFFQGRIYQEWKSKGSLLWIHGKRWSYSILHLMPSDAVL